jgi:hypothetical protein
MTPASVRGSACALALALLSAPSREPPLRLATPDSDYKPSIDSTLRRDDAGCATVRSTVWHPLSGLDYTGRLRVQLPAREHAGITLFVGDQIPLDLDAERVDGRPVAARIERLPYGPGILVPPDYWLDDGVPWNAPPAITRMSIDALPQRPLDVRVSLGRRAPRVLARLTGYPAGVHASICAERMADAEMDFATGWYGEESGDAGQVRWMGEQGAVLIASADGRAVHVRLAATPAVPSAGGTETVLRLRVNDFFDATPMPMLPGSGIYEWDVPDSAWVPGTNELFFTVSRTLSRGRRTVGLALSSLTVR